MGKSDQAINGGHSRIATRGRVGFYDMARNSVLTSLNEKATEVVAAIAVTGRTFVASNAGIEERLPPNVVRVGSQLMVAANAHPSTYRSSRLAA